MTPWTGIGLIAAFFPAAVAAGHWALATGFTVVGVGTLLMMRRIL